MTNKLAWRAVPVTLLERALKLHSKYYEDSFTREHIAAFSFATDFQDAISGGVDMDHAVKAVIEAARNHGGPCYHPPEYKPHCKFCGLKEALANYDAITEKKE